MKQMEEEIYIINYNKTILYYATMFPGYTNTIVK